MESTEKNSLSNLYKKANLLVVPLLVGALSVSISNQALAAFEPFRNQHETLEDNFDDSALDPKWTRLFSTAEGNGVDRWGTIDEGLNPGELTIVPDVNGWWGGRIGGYLYQDVTGHFVATVDITANDITDTTTPSTFVNAGGLHLRKITTAVALPNNEDYLSVLAGEINNFNPGGWEINNKITDDSTPTFIPQAGWQNSELRMAHYGPYNLVYVRDASIGGAWTALDSYDFVDLGSTIQVGLVAEADFLSVVGVPTVTYNAGPVAGTPDLTAKFDSFAINNTATIGNEIITLINTLGVTGFANVDGAKGFIASVHGITLDQSGTGQDHTVASTDVCYFDSGNVGTMNAYNNDAGTIGRLDADLFIHEASKSINTDSVVEMSGAAIPDNSFLCWGNDDAAFTTTAAQTPAAVDTRLGRSWKVQHTNDVGNVTLKFDLTDLNFGNDISIDKFALLLDSADADFSDATVINPTSVSNGKVHFSNIAFPSGGTTYSFFTLAVNNSVVHNGSVSATVEINDGSANAPALADSDFFGASVAAPGDTNADNIPDVLVGAPGDDTGGADSGAFYIAPLTAGGALSGAPTKIDSGTANAPTISAGDLFGSSLANMGDLDWNGTIDIVAGAPGNDTGGTDRGAVHIMYMNDNETIASSLTIDSNTTGGPTLSDGDGMGYAVANVGDINGDWVPDLVVTSPTFDGNGVDEGTAWLMFLHCDGSLDSTVSIDGATGVALADGDAYGSSVSSVGDLNADGVPDIAIGAINDGTGGAASGAVHILFMNSNGTIASTAKIDSTTANMSTIAPGSQFGSSIANMGDLDGDGIPDLAVGNASFKGQGASRGGYHIIYMNANGSVKSAVAIEEGTANVPAAADGDQLGTSVVALGDLDGDGFTDMAIGSSMVDGGGTDRGEFHVSFLDNTAYPVITDAGITVNTGSGAGGQFLTGNTLNVQWDTTVDVQPAALVGNPTVNLTEFGGGAAVALLDDGLSGDGGAGDGVYGVNYTIVAGVINTTGLNVYVSATNANGTTGEIVDCTDASLNNTGGLPVVTDANISIAGGTCTAGAYTTGDTITLTWDNSAATGDNNAALTADPVADLSAFGGGAAITMTDTAACGGTAADEIWEACFTIVAGAIDASNLNGTVSATNASGTTGPISDTSNASVDNQAPNITDNGTLAISTDGAVIGVAAVNGGGVAADIITQSAVVLAAADGDTTTIDLTAVTGEATLAAGTPSVGVIPGAIDGVLQTYTISVTDNGCNTTTTASDAITVDNEIPVITTPGSFTQVTDPDGDGMADVGDTFNYTDPALGLADGDTITVDLTGVTGVALANAAGNPHTVIAGVLSGNTSFTETVTDNGGNVVTGATSTLSVYNAPVVVTPPVTTTSGGGGGGGGGSSARTACFGLSAAQCNAKVNPPVEVSEPENPTPPSSGGSSKAPTVKQELDPADPLAECKIRHFKREADEIPRMEILPLTGITIPRLLIEKYDAFSIFEDMTINDPYYRSLYEMYAQGVMYFPGGKTIAKPNDFVRRSDAVQQILKGAEKSIEIECPKDIFLDVPSFGGFADYINNAFEFGIVSGYKGGYFKPLEKLNFAELSKIMTIAFDLNTQEQNGGHWADPYIQALADQNLLPDGFEAKGQYGRLITRGELAEFIFRATKMQDDKKNRYLENMALEVPKYDLSLTATRSSIEHAGVWLEDLTSVGAAFYNDIRGDKVVPVVWGHSSVWPFDPTPVGAAFRPLVDADGEGLVEGDTFSLTVEGQKKEYEVIRRQYVEAADIDLLKELSDQADALVFTCDFPDFAAGRWVFVGKEK